MKRKRILSSGPDIFVPDADDSRSFPVPAISLTGERVNLRCRFASNSRIDPKKRWVNPEPEIMPVRVYQPRPRAKDPYLSAAANAAEDAADAQRQAEWEAERQRASDAA